MKRLHKCGLPGCGKEIPLQMAFCREHWNPIPGPIKNAILMAYYKFGALTPEHNAAMDAAVKSIQSRRATV